MHSPAALQERMKKTSEQLNQLSLQLIKAREDIDELLVHTEAYRSQSEEEKRHYMLEYDRLALRLVDILDDFDSPELIASEMDARLKFFRTRLEDAINREGITAMGAEASAYDPKKHDAEEAVVDAGKPEGTILRVKRSGYMRGQKILRKARVVITQRNEK